VALTPALELATGEQGAGVLGSARDRGSSQARAQRDGGKVVAHLVLVVTTEHALEKAQLAAWAEAQLAVAVVSCSHGLQGKQSGLRAPAKMWCQAQISPSPKPPIISTIRGRSRAVALRPGHVRSVKRTCALQA